MEVALEGVFCAQEEDVLKIRIVTDIGMVKGRTSAARWTATRAVLELDINYEALKHPSG